MIQDGREGERRGETSEEGKGTTACVVACGERRERERGKGRGEEDQVVGWGYGRHREEGEEGAWRTRLCERVFALT